MKSLHFLEEACFMGFSGGFEQGKPETALPGLGRFIPVIPAGVNLQYFLTNEIGNKKSGKIFFPKVTLTSRPKDRYEGTAP
jgi:hypothetical protein